MNAGTQAVRRSQPSNRGQTEVEVAPRSSHRPGIGSEAVGGDAHPMQAANRSSEHRIDPRNFSK
jgi:hypothetical protein